TRAQGVARPEREVGRIRRRFGGVASAYGELDDFGQRDFEPVAEAGEYRQAVDEVVAVVAPADDMQRKVDLRRRGKRHDHGGSRIRQASVLGQPVLARLGILYEGALRSGLPLVLG